MLRERGTVCRELISRKAEKLKTTEDGEAGIEDTQGYLT